MKNRIQGYDIPKAKMLAKYYYEIGKTSWEAVTDVEVQRDGNLLSKSIVGNTNMAFSCEIMIKIIAFQENISIVDLSDKHNFKDLFKLLSDDARDTIKENTIRNYNDKNISGKEYEEADFNNDLYVYENSFVECRYWYEIPAEGKEGKKAGQLFIYSFAKALLEYINISFN